jgi:hypothetical protein
MARAKSKSICFAESREKYYDSTATPNGKKWLSDMSGDSNFFIHTAYTLCKINQLHGK